MMECLNTMIGILPPDFDCPCVVNGLSEETRAALSVSTSGKYLENLKGGLSFREVKAAATDCQTYASLAIGARDLAVQTVKDALIETITTKFSKAKKPYTGNLGHPSFTSPYQPTTDIIGMRIRPTSTNKDSQLIINSLQLSTFTPLTTIIKLYKTPELVSGIGGQTGTLIAQWPITTTAQSYTFVDGFTSLKLPLYEGGKPLEYFIVYDRGGVMPMDIQPTCNCPGVNEEVRQYVQVQGVELNSVNDMPGLQTQYTGGIVANVIMQCRVEGLVCRGPYDEEDPISLVLANAILYKAGEILYDKVLQSSAITRLTMMSREHLYGKRNMLEAQYNNRMEFIGDVIDISSSDCFICKEVQDGVPTVIEILA